MNYIPVKYPSWLPEAISATERLFKVIKLGRLPERLLGKFIVIDCLRLLRSITGSDEASVKLLQTYVSKKYKCKGREVQ